jgi:hypothetical protein
MIFSSVNEDGMPAYMLVLLMKKTVTRRRRPEPVNVLRAVQSGRGKKATGYIQITDCSEEKFPGEGIKNLQKEAKKEGFRYWSTVSEYLKKYIGDAPCFRIEFRLVGAFKLPRDGVMS